MRPAEVGEWLSLADSRRIPKTSGTYIIRNRLTGMEYVGKSLNVRARLGQHRNSKPGSGQHISRTINKHGPAAFDCMLYLTGSSDEIIALEIVLISERGTMTPGGYNLALGGQGAAGYKHSQEARDRQSKRQTGRKMSDQAKANNAAAQTGLKRSAEHRANIGAGGLGRVVSQETIEKRRPKLLGVRQSPEVRAKMSTSAKLRDPKHIAELAAKASKPVIVWFPHKLAPVEYASVAQAAKAVRRTSTSVVEYCRGQTRHPMGLFFGYL